MASQSGDVVVDRLEERPVRRAALVVEAGATLVAFDVEAGEFVRMPRPVPEAKIRSLSADGAQVVLVAERKREHGGVCLLTLEDGEQRWFETPAYRCEQDAMSSMGGTTLATLCGSEEEEPGDAVLGLLDPATGQRRDLWRAVGSASWESGLCWSPDGRLIAVTYMIWDDEADDDALATVIIDAADGSVRAGPFVGAFILGSAHATWLSGHELICRDEAEDISRLRIVDAHTGGVDMGPEISGHPWASVNGRFVCEVSAIERGVGATEEHAFYTTNRDHLDRRPLFTLRPKADIAGVHIAHDAFAESFLSFSS